MSVGNVLLSKGLWIPIAVALSNGAVILEHPPYGLQPSCCYSVVVVVVVVVVVAEKATWPILQMYNPTMEIWCSGL